MKFVHRASKYLFAILMVSILFQSVAIIVIHYSESADRSPGGTIAGSFRADNLGADSAAGNAAGNVIRSASARAADRIARESLPVTSEAARFRGIDGAGAAGRIQADAARQIEEVLRGANGPSSVYLASADAATDGSCGRRMPGMPQDPASAATDGSGDDPLAGLLRGTGGRPAPAGILVSAPAPASAAARPVAAVDEDPFARAPEIPTAAAKPADLDPIVRRSVIRAAFREPPELPADLFKTGPAEPPPPAAAVRTPPRRATAARETKPDAPEGRYVSLSTLAPKRGAHFSDEVPPADPPALERDAARDDEGRRDRPSARRNRKERVDETPADDGVGRVVKKADTKRSLKWPLRGRISSGFGMRIHPVTGRWDMHTGLDLAAATGDPIRSAMGGRVTFAGWMGGYGKIVVVTHANGLETRYAHCSKLLVRRGDSVKDGQLLAKVGSTGTSTGPHCHFEVLKRGRHLNPAAYLK